MLIFINMIMTMLTIKVISVVDDHNNRTWMNQHMKQSGYRFFGKDDNDYNDMFCNLYLLMI